ncbi:hypothetical protein J4E85_006804 [Alternaria conjuncta]|uniref:uncharacterized protein n=1 Tax=Alternaria conjuncta TaxID=181017 RepID=UPI0022203FA4|nr:uncharacterized protein J4E85_006804 [Alternaria conjuncta]KAI4926510.1 hypothetical protein J4E85_006804 [Alternaria conjuncta]
MPSQLVDDCIRLDLLCRLRWNLMTSLHNIEIVVGSEDEEKILPLIDHPYADEEISEPGLSRIEVNSCECLEKFDLSYDSSPEEDGYRPPPPLIIENEDGKHITLRQFVTEVHAYLNEHLAELKKAQRVMAAEPWSETMLYYRRAWPRRTDDGNIIVNVEMMPRAPAPTSSIVYRTHPAEVTYSMKSSDVSLVGKTLNEKWNPGKVKLSYSRIVTEIMAVNITTFVEVVPAGGRVT